jgi:prolyl-tRNA synthetase
MDRELGLNKMDNELGITVTKQENFSEWYTQLITKGKFIGYYDISGCYTLLPNSFGIWENIQKYLDAKLKKIDVQNVQFPLFINKKNLSAEASHLEGFTPEVAWVTKGGTSDLEEEIAVRPTSECAMYPTFANLIQSHTDLPLKYNQWCNVVRWEMKHCTAFIRQREFSWSETHACYPNREVAMNDVLYVLDLYKDVYNELLCIPVIRGIKTENEKFAGADETHTIETYIPITGKGIQAATSHLLGQNFSKIFNITFQDIDEQNKYVWQISCGITIRSIGIMLMTHGDDKGAIIPPRVAPIQIVIIPIIKKGIEEKVISKCNEVYNELKDKFRVKIDSGNHKPGWKYNFWELRGIPLRIEIGPKDLEDNTITFCKRNTFKKSIEKTFKFDGIPETYMDSITIKENEEYGKIEVNESLCSHTEQLLNEIHQEMYDKAYQQMLSHITIPKNEAEFKSALENKNLCYINWCNKETCEKHIKETYAAKSLCIPKDLDINIEIDNCCICNDSANLQVLFGKSI